MFISILNASQRKEKERGGKGVKDSRIIRLRVRFTLVIKITKLQDHSDNEYRTDTNECTYGKE